MGYCRAVLYAATGSPPHRPPRPPCGQPRPPPPPPAHPAPAAGPMALPRLLALALGFACCTLASYLALLLLGGGHAIA